MNNNNISRAQQRVKEMNRMAQQYVQQSNSFMRQMNRPRQEQPRFEPVRNIPAAEKKSDPPKPVSVQSHANVPQFTLDNEKLMILLIMYLLIKEKADIKLIAALGYLLL